MIEYLWHREVADAHDWMTDLLSDFHLNATFVGVHTVDDRLAEWRKEVLRPLLTHFRVCAAAIWYQDVIVSTQT